MILIVNDMIELPPYVTVELGLMNNMTSEIFNLVLDDSKELTIVYALADVMQHAERIVKLIKLAEGKSIQTYDVMHGRLWILRKNEKAAPVSHTDAAPPSGDPNQIALVALDTVPPTFILTD